MILIFTQSQFELSTNQVMDWLWAYQVPFKRVNLDELSEYNLKIVLNPNSGILELEMQVGSDIIRSVDKHAIWFRRYNIPDNLRISKPANGVLGTQIRRHISQEYMSLLSAVYTSFAHCEWLNHPKDMQISKIRMLQCAIQAGLKVPTTSILGSRVDVTDFSTMNGSLITKCLGEGEHFTHGSRKFVNYTAKLDEAELVAMNSSFYPSLFQENISKRRELRVFYLDGSCYTVAIFSQADAQTAVDFRVYNHAVPNRVVPYQLPTELEMQLSTLMQELDMKCGSIDLIHAHDGSYIFLEVNPIGQFAMVSVPGNYQLEKKVSEYLIALHYRTCNGQN